MSHSLKAGECYPSGWCDLSNEHREVRQRLEALVAEALKGNGYQLTVIVAPYGSGKTTLLKHLEWYASSKLSVPARRVELRELVDYIVERYGIVHESELPRVVEELAERLTGSRRSVLLLDEVEESYDSLAAVVEHETSPLRGLADAAREGRLQTVVVLAFGPSSALKEALFGPVAWRASVVGLPLIGKNYVMSLISRMVEDAYAEALANTAWWMARGRTAWAMFVAENVLPKLVRALGHGVSALADLISLDPIFESEVVDGVPLLDRNALASLGELLGSRTAAVLASMVGPLPLSVVEKLVGGEAAGLPSVAVVYARMAVRVDDFVSQARRVMHRIARSRELPSATVERAVSLLRTVLEAWSYRGLLPYDSTALRELVGIAADLAREVYLDEPRVHALLEAVEAVAANLPAVEVEEPLVALRPEVVAQLYPPVTSSPLVGCAKQVGFDKVVSVVAEVSEKDLLAYSGRIGEALGLTQLASKLGYRGVVLVPSPLRDRVSEAIACSLLAEPALVVTAPPVPHVLRVLEDLGRALVIEASEKLDKMMAALIYGEAVGIEACSVASLEGRDRRSVQQFAELVKALALEKAGTRRPGRLALVLEKLQSVTQGLGRVGEAVLSVVASTASPESLVEAVREVEARISRVEAVLRERLGIRVPLRIELSEAVSEVAKLYAEARSLGLDALEKLAERCGVAGLLAAEPVEAGSDAVNELAKSLQALGELSLDWLPSRLRESVEELKRAVRELLDTVSAVGEKYGGRAVGLASLALTGVASAVRSLAQLLSRTDGAVKRVREKAGELPEELRSQVLARLANALSKVSSLVELERVSETLVQEASAFAELVEEYVSLRRIVESRVEEVLKLVAALESVNHAHPSGEEVAVNA